MQTNDEVRKRKHLSPEAKYQIFLESVKANGNGAVGEILRSYGIHSSDLKRIRLTVEQGAIQAFKENKSRKPKVSHEEHKAVLEEKMRLEDIILGQAAEINLLKKKNCSTYKVI